MTEALNDATPVLVTGGSGFIAGHCILQLLATGRSVRTTIRSLSKESAARAVLTQAGASDEELSRLEFVAADLTDDRGWSDAVSGVEVILHVASPVMPGHVKNEDDVIVPAREGALRVLRAARGAGVRRVVLTSAFHAVGFGHGHIDHVFTEDDWSPLNGPGMDAYGRSKVLAEQAAWEYVRSTRGAPELVTILPVAVLGPIMGDAVTGSNHLLQQMLSGGMPGFPDVAIPIVDVRDVAAAHVAAASAPRAAGQRILLTSQESAIPMREIGALLKSAFGERASKVPTRSLPSLILRLAARFRPELRGPAAELGYVKRRPSARPAGNRSSAVAGGRDGRGAQHAGSGTRRLTRPSSDAMLLDVRGLLRKRSTGSRAGLAGVYLYGDQWVITTHNQTRDGVWLESSAVVLDGTDPSALGRACQEAIDRSRKVPAVNRRLNPSTGPAPSAVGARSWRAFAHQAFNVVVDRQGDTVAIHSTQRVHDHFAIAAEGVRLSWPCDVTVLGEAVIDAMELSRAHTG